MAEALVTEDQEDAPAQPSKRSFDRASKLFDWTVLVVCSAAAQNQQCCIVMCEFKVHLLSVVENRGCSPPDAALEQ